MQTGEGGEERLSSESGEEVAKSSTAKVGRKGVTPQEDGIVT